MVNYHREPTTIEQQINILKSRNLHFDDNNIELAKTRLLNTGYFRLKGYCLTFYESVDFFKDGTTFDTIYNLYRFDERLRLLIFQLIAHLETSYKAQIAQYFSLEYGALAHYKVENFKVEQLHVTWIKDLNKAISYSENRRESYVNHYNTQYDGEFPIWVAFELSNLTDLSKFYSNINTQAQNKISKAICKVPRVYLSSWLRAICAVRNICAHGGRLYDRNIASVPKMDKKIAGMFEGNKIFATIYAMKKMCYDENYWVLFQRNLQILIDIYIEDIDLKKIGFPDNWRDILQ